VSIALFLLALAPAILQLSYDKEDSTMIHIVAVLLLLAALVFAYSAFLGWRYYQSGKKNTDRFAEVVKAIDDSATRITLEIRRTSNAQTISRRLPRPSFSQSRVVRHNHRGIGRQL
jgi:hypothetical protein